MYWGVFLKKEASSTERIYTGHYDYGEYNDGNKDDEIMITVQGRVNQDPSANVIFQLPDDDYAYYTLVFQDANHWDSGIVSIRDIDDYSIFEGKYDKDSDTFLDSKGRPYFAFYGSEDDTEMTIQKQSILESIVDIVYETDTRIRGEVRELVLALLTFILTWFEFCFPLTIFRIKYGWAVYNPEPTDSYIFWHKIGLIIMTLLGIFLMIKAL